VSIPLPLFNNGNAAVAQAQAQQTQAEALRRLAMVEAERSIASAQAELANAATTARTAGGPALAAAAEAARIARIGYAGGKFSQLDLLEAERTLAQTRADATDALAAYHDAEARLARLTAPATLSTELTPTSARPATPGDSR
jgi:cobalt-zinc-cadmium efflux system outer membrane protein